MECLLKESTMRIRRCGALLIEPRERLEFDLNSLLTGGAGLRAEREWAALAPHLGREQVVSAEEVTALGTVPRHEWIEYATWSTNPDQRLIDGLLQKGLVVSDAPEFAVMRAQDDALRAGYWHERAAVMHAFGRWQGVAAGEEVRNIGIESVIDLVEKLGTPPTHFHARGAAEDRIALVPPEPSAIDDLLRRRTTCRNFDVARKVPFSTFAHILHRTFGAQAAHAVTADTAIVKKTSPSAGGLHPTEAYLLVQHVENLAAGLYHYHVGDHALEPLQLLSDEEALALAGRFVAQQDWFARVHAMVILAPRFTRSFWKYRDHAKVYRAVTLDVGHLSQTLQISATEFGLGAFVTAAINEVDIEQALGLQPMQESPLAVCGFGWRAHERSSMEFDPQHAVWPAG
jgi:putative peptide maturation dehydrogenase